MESIELLVAALVLLVMLCVGTVAHEFAHAVVLHALGVPYDIEWLPERDSGAVHHLGIFGTWATVTPRSIPREIPAWGLRLSAVAPLALATPILLVFVGILPDPLRTDNLAHVLFTVTWLGFALPSPQDFSLFWYADRVIESSESDE